MGELLPTRQAQTLQEALLDYLTTTFALADSDVQAALSEFLSDKTNGIFKGPFIRTRLPFAPASKGWEEILDARPVDYPPYIHQAQAYERLCSRDHEPLPTLVTTGTGSGKTESFTHPILDHVLRAKRQGQKGIKALILYPMNALASDQSERLKEDITRHYPKGESNPFSSIRAAIYTGEQDGKRRSVTADGLINDRYAIRKDPPDILLTNYKMLDQLLLRNEDARLWADSADSLRYVVLDELHTYDGAQGTDVAMLLRRLKITLSSYNEDAHFTPVGTSATLGDGEDVSSIVEFASDVFGEPFDESCVITESRVSLDEWLSDQEPSVNLHPTRLTASLIKEINCSLREETSGREICHKLLSQLLAQDGKPEFSEMPDAKMLRYVKALDLVQNLIRESHQAIDLDKLVRKLLPGIDIESGRQFISLLVAAISHLRDSLGRNVVSVDVHLWVRELSRIDRMASTAASFAWSDDGQSGSFEIADKFPAIFCRQCGRSGWGIELATTGNQLSTSDKSIRKNHAAKKGRFRALIHAPIEGEQALDGKRIENLAWLDVQSREILNANPEKDDERLNESLILPVLVLSGKNAEKDSANDVCPSCQRTDAIRFLGAAVSTLLSVSLSSLFGQDGLDSREKKALVFTDSVQDAAHRSGFISARSYTLTLRSLIRNVITREMNLSELPGEIIAYAGDDQLKRYSILPKQFADSEKYAEFYERKKLSQVSQNVRSAVQRRLLFGIELEFGMTSKFGRTLEETGSVGVYVNLESATRVATIARSVVTQDNGQILGEIDEAALVAWVRGIVEHMRVQGAISHEWLNKYIIRDGNRWEIWGGRPKGQGMPAFPKGRSAPAFPRVGGGKLKSSLMDSVTDPQSWFARWTNKVLQLNNPTHGARLARCLLEKLSDEGLLTKTITESGASVYEIKPDNVIVAPTEDEKLASGRNFLICDVCHSQLSVSEKISDQLDGAPCTYVRCVGHLTPLKMNPNNFYRTLYASSDMRRIVAREHTSLLDNDVRKKYEDGFKHGSEPGNPNTIVATPTLEMGIDIGDLSAAFLASLPKTVASYMQRIGRAGRQTGNSLNLTYVRGRGKNLPHLSNPEDFINGAVTPPAIYLSAEEILKRQYFAYLLDRFAREGAHLSRSANSVISSCEQGSLLGDLIEDAGQNHEKRLEEFLASFGSYVSADAKEALKIWAKPVDGVNTSGLAKAVYEASGQWAKNKENLVYRIREIETAIPELKRLADSPAATDDDSRSYRTALSGLNLTKKRLSDITGQYWISALEELGLLPNYTLVGEAATLDVAIRWYDTETSQWIYQADQAMRPTQQALHEFAPGATFYAKGLEVTIDTVDPGSNGEDIRQFAFCAKCGFAQDIAETGKTKRLGACPRCGDVGFEDKGQLLDVIELKRASAAIRRDEALIDDQRDDRKRAFYHITLAADIDPQHTATKWYIDGYDFGALYSKRLTLRWLNMGRAGKTSSSFEIAGNSVPSPKFRICEQCGHIDSEARTNTMDEHRPWCVNRKSQEEHTRDVALMRTLTTQGLVIVLPWTVAHGDAYSLPSLQAALMLGITERFGGGPAHLGIDIISIQENSESVAALLLHDTVPGGTGYLADLADPENMRGLLWHAYQVVKNCDCKSSGKLACEHCLLPYSMNLEFTSRQSAERHLKAILKAGVRGDEDASEESTWNITEQVQQYPQTESALETRFREDFTNLIKGLGASVREEPGPNGNTIRFRLGDKLWTLTPQVRLGNVQPDFVLEAINLNRRVLIFTDGFQFHATSAINRLADDAIKREARRIKGDYVLAVTSDDLTAYEAGSRGVPNWINERSVKVLAQQFGFSQASADAFLSGPMGILAKWIQSTDEEDFGKAARAIPFAINNLQRFAPPERAMLIDLAIKQLDQDFSAGNGAGNAVSRRLGNVSIVGKLIKSKSLFDMKTIVLLDDRPPALKEASYRDDWVTWLTLSNILTFNLQEPMPKLCTMQSLDYENTGITDLPGEAPARAKIDIEVWPDVKEIFDDDDNVIRIAAELMSRKAPQPDVVGEEIGSKQIPVDLAWNDQKIAILLEDPEEYRNDLAKDGWSIFSGDVDEIIKALRVDA